MRSLYEDARQRLWIGTLAGVSALDSTRTQLTHFNHRYWGTSPGIGQLARSILGDQDGRIWIAATTELMRLDPSTGKFSYSRRDPLEEQALQSDLPNVVYRDRSGVLWVGTNGYGLNVHDPKANRFGLFRPPGSEPGKSAGFSVYTLFEDSSGAIWIDAQVLYRWDRRTGTLTSLQEGRLPPG